MKNLTTAFLFFSFLISAFGQGDNQNFVTSDIDNFWIAYDKITATKDRAEQLDYINELYIDKGSPGLKAIMQLKRYTDKSYIDAINDHPLFWKSIRANTLKSKQIAKQIEVDVAKIKKIYPALKPAKIYFTIGAFRTGATTLGGMVLIGSELAMADKDTVATEFSQQFSNLKPYFDTNPIANIVGLNAHEFIHTQQKTTVANSLLGQSVMEGVAEFVSILATQKPHPVPEPFVYGKQNKDRIREKFAAQMYDDDYGFWLYENADNEFKTRDLGYYVGYAICEEYYKKSANKKSAIKEMIELDYNNLAELEKFVEKSGYFAKPIAVIKQDYKIEYEKSRPTVVNITGIKNGSQNVSPNVAQITIEFSTKMNKDFTNFDFGPLGEASSLRIKKLTGFAEDGKSISIEVELKPDKHYQLVVERGFRNEKGISLIPYLIDFKTAAQ